MNNCSCMIATRNYIIKFTQVQNGQLLPYYNYELILRSFLWLDGPMNSFEVVDICNMCTLVYRINRYRLHCLIHSDSEGKNMHLKSVGPN